MAKSWFALFLMSKSMCADNSALEPPAKGKDAGVRPTPWCRVRRRQGAPRNQGKSVTEEGGVSETPHPPDLLKTPYHLISFIPTSQRRVPSAAQSALPPGASPAAPLGARLLTCRATRGARCALRLKVAQGLRRVRPHPFVGASVRSAGRRRKHALELRFDDIIGLHDARCGLSLVVVSIDYG